jgi:hypothetical protein
MKKPSGTATGPACTKLTARLFAPMYDDFDRQMEAALLRRDAFLDRVIAREIPNIREDLAGKRQSNAAHRHVAGLLKSLGGKKAPPLKQVSITVRKSTADELRAVADEHNIVRDSLINWIIVLLRSNDSVLKDLELPTRIQWGRRDGTQDMPTSPLKAIEETQWDPFYYLRAACHDRHGAGLYAIDLPGRFWAFSCHLGDEWVPGTEPFKEREAEMKELMDALDALPDPLTKTRAK